MERNEERRDEHEKRVPIRAAVELAESQDDAFEADAVNLSRGGMSLRSQCLPDVGTRLWCRFEHPPSGSVIEAEGEVVWAQLEGAASGEIGLAFTNLDPQTELLIEQIIALHGSVTANGDALDIAERERAGAALDADGPPADQVGDDAGHDSLEQPILPPAARARVANLSLEGISEPLSAQLAELSPDHAVFEQVMPLLQLGRAVSADAPELLGRRGAIAGVELRMMGHVPTLAVIVEFGDGQPRSYGEASLSSTDVPAVPGGDDALAHDTEPDLEAPQVQMPREQALPAAQGVTAAEFSKSPIAAKPRQLALDVAPAPAAPRVARVEPARVEPARIEPARAEPEGAQDEPMAPALADEPRPSASLHKPGATTARPSRLDETKVLELADPDDDARDDASAESLEDPFAPAAPAWRPFVLAGLRGLRALARALQALGVRAARLLGASGVAALPRIRLLLLRARALAKQAGAAISPKLGAARRLAAAQLGKKRRRTTAGGHAVAARDSGGDTAGLLRTLGLGALVTVIAGLGVYAMLPTAAPELELHRAIEAPQGEAGISGEQASAVEAPLAQAEQELPMPSAAVVPEGSAFAVDVRDKSRSKGAAAGASPASTAPAKATPAPQPAAASAPSKPAPRAMRFGAASAPSHAQTFTLRMSKPITAVNGSADSGGFTVSIMGSLSLDRAGPISAAHRGVARAMVLNKGDHAELTIRFADGKRPAYQVRGDGTTLYVVIEDV